MLTHFRVLRFDARGAGSCPLARYTGLLRNLRRATHLFVNDVGIVRAGVPTSEPIATSKQRGHVSEHGLTLTLHATAVAIAFAKQTSIRRSKVSVRPPLSGTTGRHCADTPARNQQVELTGLKASNINHLYDHLLALDRCSARTRTAVAGTGKLQLVANAAGGVGRTKRGKPV